MDYYEFEDLINANNTAYNNKKNIDYKSFSLEEFKNLTIIREFQNLNTSFRNSVIPVRVLEQEQGEDIKITEFLNARQYIYKNVFNEDKLFWKFKFNFEIFKGKNNDLFFIKIKFKKEHHFLWFFALMGIIKSNWSYKGEFTARERKLLFKLKNPINNNMDLDKLKWNLFLLEQKREDLKKDYDKLKGLNKNLNRYRNKWGGWSSVPPTTRARFVRMNEKKRALKANRLKIKRLKSLIFDVEDKLLNTGRLWNDY